MRCVIVVGYSTITLRSGALGSGASFKTIAKTGMRLTDIIPTGYENQSVWYTGSRATGFSDQITIQVLDDGGNVSTNSLGKLRSFMFKRNGKNGAWTDNGYWHRTGETAAITTDNDETFKMGEGLWIQTSANAYRTAGCGPDQYKLKFPGIDDTYVEDAE